MKKYNKPEIVALALETVDVIATSTVDGQTVSQALANAGVEAASIKTVANDIETLTTKWNW